MDSAEQIVVTYLDTIIQFGPVDTVVADARSLRALSTVPRMLTTEDAVRMTLACQEGRFAPAECREWARFLLGRCDVSLESRSEWDLLEFLEEWSFSESDDDILSSVVEWQWRFGNR